MLNALDWCHLVDNIINIINIANIISIANIINITNIINIVNIVNTLAWSSCVLMTFSNSTTGLRDWKIHMMSFELMMSLAFAQLIRPDLVKWVWSSSPMIESGDPLRPLRLQLSASRVQDACPRGYLGCSTSSSHASQHGHSTRLWGLGLIETHRNLTPPIESSYSITHRSLRVEKNDFVALCLLELFCMSTTAVGLRLCALSKSSAYDKLLHRWVRNTDEDSEKCLPVWEGPNRLDRLNE